MEREYDVAFTKKPRVIMDCGANIGLASIVFANKFHRSRIIAVEPDPENFRIAEKNLAPYPGATVVRGAAWKRNGELTVYDPGGEHGEWGLRVAESPPSGARVVGRVPAMTLDRIMADFELSYIDFLKIDIEGAEAEVFQDASAWIDRVGVLLIECHERFRPGCESIVQRAAAGFEVQYREANHLLFARPGRIRRLRGKKFR